MTTSTATPSSTTHPRFPHSTTHDSRLNDQHTHPPTRIMSSAISFTYTLDPPASIDASAVGQPKSGEHSFPVTPGAGRSATASYYTAASASLKEAQVKANEVFTAWKDSIGDAEKHKENTGKVVKGQGKTARMMAANKAAEAAFDAAEDDESDEDGVDLAEAGACELPGMRSGTDSQKCDASLLPTSC